MFSAKEVALILLVCLLLLAVIFSPIILCMCFPPIYSGVVTHKEYKPSRVHMMPSVSNKQIINLPKVIPEEYNITIVKGDQEATHSVGRALYERVKIGDYINIKGE